MIIKVIFTNPENNIIPIINQKELNSYIHKCIGVNNDYHDKFSDYSISSIQGGKLYNKNMLSFENSTPYIIVTSDNLPFISTLMSGIQNSNHKFFNMEFSRFEVADFVLGEYCDTIMTVSPILLKKNGYKLTFKHEKWITILTDQLKSKLKHKGIVDDSFHIEIRNISRAKEKVIWVGNVFNPCSYISLKVYGKKETRLAIYNMGFGNSTGSGFGTIRLYNE
jgi:CRISPR-associated endoribonuclease Cas6